MRNHHVRRSRHLAAWLAALVAVTGAALGSGGVTSATGAPHQDGYQAVVRRTEYGIPHVLASDFRGLGYGYGYAFAQDNLCTLADTVLTVAGERSRYFDPNAPADDALTQISTETGCAAVRCRARGGRSLRSGRIGG